MTNKTIITDLFSQDSKEFDTPKKLNRTADYTFTEEFMQNLKEEGLTYEMLKDLEGQVEVFKYRTQITIHGQFPETQITRIFGYKNCERNNNGSLGIRYNAIDVKKKMELNKMLLLVMVHKKIKVPTLIRNSSEMVFEVESRKLEIIKEIYDRIDTSLFYGRKNVYKTAHPLFGVYYVLRINIGVIEEGKLLDIFTNWTGLSIEEYNTLQAEVTAEETKAKEESDKQAKKLSETCQKHYDEAHQQIQHLQPWDGTLQPGTLLVRATKDPKTPTFQYLQLEAGSFGRIKIITQKTTELTGMNLEKYSKKLEKAAKLVKQELGKEKWYLFRASNKPAVQPKPAPQKQQAPKNTQTPAQADQPVNAQGLELWVYKNGVALFGDSRPYAKEVGPNGFGGKPNYYLVHPVTGQKTFGWVFSPKAVPALEAFFNIKLITEQKEAA